MKKLTLKELQSQLKSHRIWTSFMFIVLFANIAIHAWIELKSINAEFDIHSSQQNNIGELGGAINKLNENQKVMYNNQKEMAQELEVLMQAYETNSSIVQCNIIIGEPEIQGKINLPTDETPNMATFMGWI